MKGLGLFDHVKHIKEVRDPDYFKNLSDLDRKTFSHFMILRALSMNPALCDDVSGLYKYFDIIPPAQFYTVLSTILPRDRTFYKWVKATKKHKFSNKLIELVAQRFEVSRKEAIDYVSILSDTKEGIKILIDICKGWGLTDKEIDNVMNNKDDDE